MELQERTIRLSKMIETLIKRCIDSKWKFPGGPNLVTLQSDVDSLSKIWACGEISDDRLVDYIVYHVYRKRESLKKGTYWHPHYMFTDYAIEKYKSQFLSESGKSGINYYINQWLDEYEISRDFLVKIVEPPRPNNMRKYVYMESEDTTKRRFLNTEGGFMLCQRSTTGWTPMSDTCKQCDFNKKCEQMTERRFPELVRIRREKHER